MKIDHIGIAVKNLNDSVNTFKKILPGIEPELKKCQIKK